MNSPVFDTERRHKARDFRAGSPPMGLGMQQIVDLLAELGRTPNPRYRALQVPIEFEEVLAEYDIRY